jgi:diguanylate cyclase (GGDEF)-like protein/PAS domain S-box-containing protein
MLGYSAAELAELRVEEYTHPDHLKACTQLFTELMAGSRDSYQLETRFRRKAGGWIWAQVAATPQRDADGQPEYAVAMIEDISNRKVAEEALVRQAELNQHQALHDSLTGLANRTLFRDRIQQAIAAAARTNKPLAVLVMDLDRFKEINDSLGHHVGDALLQELGNRLKGVTRASDTVARLGGDEFGLLLPEQSSPAGVIQVIERVREAVEEPIVLQGLPLAVEASVGVAFFPDDGSDEETLLQRADVAMYLAKEGNSSYAFYDSRADSFDPARLTLVGELRRGIEQRELVLYYQPKASLASGEVTSVEALLRWNHPERGLVMPDDFIPLAQQTGLIKPLTLYVVDEALRQCRSWQKDGLSLAIAVNLSARNLLDVGFPEQVQRLLGKWVVDCSLLEFEITESTMLMDPLRAKLVLDKLSSLGIRLAIDDFGTGYSSLAYLKRLPIKEIKIDRSFVVNMIASEDDATIVRSTIELGRNLGLEVVAEGVESQEIWNRLSSLGCTTAQGFYLSEPVPAEDLRRWLLERAQPLAS